MNTEEQTYMPMTSAQIKTETELTRRYLEQVPHAYFNMKGRNISLEKGNTLGLTFAQVSEAQLRQMVSPTTTSDLERFYLTLTVTGFHTVTLMLSLKSDGQYSWYDFRYQVSPGQKGQFQVQGLIINVDNSIQKSRSLETAKSEEIEARSKEMFLNNLSTEIRSPLNIILGFAELLSNEDFELTEEERTNYCQIIHGNSQVLMTLVNEILDLSRIESGRLQFVVKETTVEDLLEALSLNWVQQMPQGVEFRYLEGRKGIRVQADKSRVEQILTEFLSNAVKFTTQGEIVLGWNYSLQDRKVEIFVEDTGCGMSQAQRSKLLDPTHGMDRMDASGSNHLGLAISQVIAKSMNIDIDIQSQEGRGSRFSIFLDEI